MKKLINKFIKSKKIKNAYKLLKDNKKLALNFYYITLLADIFLLQKSHDAIIFGMLALYFFFIKVFKLENRWTFILCISLLIVMFISYIISSTSIPTEKAAVWLILFLGVGIIQQWRELNFVNHKNNN